MRYAVHVEQQDPGLGRLSPRVFEAGVPFFLNRAGPGPAGTSSVSALPHQVAHCPLLARVVPRTSHSHLGLGPRDTTSCTWFA
jgi:hypothetical protein